MLRGLVHPKNSQEAHAMEALSYRRQGYRAQWGADPIRAL